MSSTNDDWFVIKDLDDFINATRALVFNNFGKSQNTDEETDVFAFNIHPDDITEIDSVLSFDESKIIVDGFLRKQQHKYNNTIRLLINDNIYYEVVSALNDRMVSNILNNLVSKGLVDTAFDSEANDFVFWIKNNEELPETD
jgi:hypothetical protein